MHTLAGENIYQQNKTISNVPPTSWKEDLGSHIINLNQLGSFIDDISAHSNLLSTPTWIVKEHISSIFHSLR